MGEIPCKSYYQAVSMWYLARDKNTKCIFIFAALYKYLTLNDTIITLLLISGYINFLHYIPGSSISD